METAFLNVESMILLKDLFIDYYIFVWSSDIAISYRFAIKFKHRSLKCIFIFISIFFN